MIAIIFAEKDGNHGRYGRIYFIICDEIMLAYQFGFVKGLEIGIDTGKQLSKEDGQ